MFGWAIVGLLGAGAVSALMMDGFEDEPTDTDAEYEEEESNYEEDDLAFEQESYNASDYDEDEQYLDIFADDYDDDAIEAAEEPRDSLDGEDDAPIILGPPDDDLEDFPPSTSLGSEFEDELYALADDETIYSDDDDLVSGTLDDDALFTGAGDDTLMGDAGDDSLYGEDDDDYLFGDDGDDYLDGGDGEDALFGIDVLSADGPLEDDDALIDFLDDTGEADTLAGGNGSDILYLGENDIAIGGEGEDLFVTGDWMEADNGAIITDFDPEEDVLVHVYAGPESVPIVSDDGFGNATIEVDGETVAVLQGVTAAEAQLAMVMSGSLGQGTGAYM